MYRPRSIRGSPGATPAGVEPSLGVDDDTVETLRENRPLAIESRWGGLGIEVAPDGDPIRAAVGLVDPASIDG